MLRLCLRMLEDTSIFFMAEANPLNVKRLITIGFEAGDYFDRVTISQQ